MLSTVLLLRSSYLHVDVTILFPNTLSICSLNVKDSYKRAPVSCTTTNHTGTKSNFHSKNRNVRKPTTKHSSLYSKWDSKYVLATFCISRI